MVTDYDIQRIVSYGGGTTRVDLTPRRRLTPARLHLLIVDLVSDWLMLRTLMPRPTGSRTARRTPSGSQAFGHPAEWASDQSARIVDLLWSWHDLVAELCGETRPAPMIVDGRRQRREDAVVRGAAEFLDCRIDELLAAGRWLPFAELPTPWAFMWEWDVDDEAFDELFDAHRHVQAATGNARPSRVLPMPCPSSECGLRTLERRQGMAGHDFIVCGACGYSVSEDAYPFLVRVLVDTLGATPVVAKQ